jgi:hypothetical protein
VPTPPPPPFLEEAERAEEEQPERAEEEDEEADEPLDSPICPRCEAPLDGTLRVRALTANVGAGGRIIVPIAYCGRCGAALEAIVRVAPDTPSD